MSKPLVEEADRARGAVLDDLASAVAPVRDSQLAVILSWLEQLITLQRSTALGFRVALWLQRGLVRNCAGGSSPSTGSRKLTGSPSACTTGC